MKHNTKSYKTEFFCSMTQLNTGETDLVYGGFGATTRHFASTAASWAILVGIYGVPTIGFVTASISIPTSFAIAEIIDSGSLNGITRTFAKKLNTTSVGCLLLGAALKFLLPETHITTNVFTGFNISNPK